MATDFSQFAQQANIAAQAQRERQAPAMFSFDQPKQEEDKYLSKEEVRQALANTADKKTALKKLVDSGFTIEGLNDTQSIQTPQIQQNNGGFMQGVADVGAGIASGAAKAVGGTLGIVGDFLSAPFSEDVSYKGIFTGGNKGGLGQLARDELARQQESGAKAFGANRESGLYKAGELGTGLVLSAATPGGVLGAAGKGAGLATKIGLGAAQGAIETGKFLGLTEGRLGTPTELGAGALIGGAIPVVGSAIRSGARYGADLLGKTTGAGGDAIRNAFKYAGNDDFVKALRGETSNEQILANANNALQMIRQNRNAVYGQGYEKFLQKSKELGSQNIDDITESFLSKVKQQGVKVKDGVLDFGRSKIANSGDEKLLTETFKDLRNFRNATPEELDILKQRIYDRFVVEKPIGTTTASEGIAKIVSGEIKEKLSKMIPEYKSLSKNYEEATSAIADISKTLSLGKPNSAMTAMTRLAQTMKDNLSYRGEALKLLEDMSGVNLTAQLAGSALSPGISKGVAGVLQGAGAGGLGVGVATGIFSPAFLATIPLGSPRLIGELANGLGITANKLKDVLSKIPGSGTKSSISQAFVSSRSQNPFKDLKFLNAVKKGGESMGISKEAVNILKGSKNAKEALEKAEKAGLADEIRKAYFGSPKYGGKPTK